MHRKDHRFALPQRHDFAPRLHPRPLLDQQKLAAGKIGPRIAEQHRQLQWEDQRAVEVLVQPVVVAGAVFQHQGRRPLLARAMAFGQIGVQIRREAPRLAEPLAPAPGNRPQPRVERAAQRLDQRRQRVAKILVLAAAIGVALHDNATAERAVVVVKRGQFAAFLGGEQG